MDNPLKKRLFGLVTNLINNGQSNEHIQKSEQFNSKARQL